MKTEGSMLSPAQHGSSIAPESPLLSLFTCCLNSYSEAKGNLLQTSLSAEIVASPVHCRQCSALNHATNPSYPDTEPRMRRIKTRTGPSVSGSTVAKTHFSNQNKQMNPLFQKLDRP